MYSFQGDVACKHLILFIQYYYSIDLATLAASQIQSFFNTFQSVSHLQLLSLQFHLILHNTATGLNMYELIPQQPDTQYSRYFQHKQSENDFAKLLDRGKQIVTLTLLVVPAVPGAGSSPGGTSSPGGGSSTPAGGEVRVIVVRRDVCVEGGLARKHLVTQSQELVNIEDVPSGGDC